MAELSERIKASIATQEQYLNLHGGILSHAGTNLGAALARGNKLIAIGCPTVARHIVSDITGRYGPERPGLPAISLCDNPSIMTAILNDYGRDKIYVRQLMALAQPGDFVLGLLAGVDHPAQDGIDQAQKMGLETLALDLPGEDELVANEVFLTAAHLLCEAAEAELLRLKPEWFAAPEIKAE